jgi:hypothetical protein
MQHFKPGGCLQSDTAMIDPHQEVGEDRGVQWRSQAVA